MIRIKLDIQRFASGTISGSTSGYFTSQVVWSSSSNGSSANSSNVTAHLQIRRTNSYTTTGTVPYSLNINGNNYSGSWYGSFSSDWVEIASRTVTVGHNSDGTKSCNINSSATGPSGTSLSGNTTTANANVTLDTIQRYAQTNNVTGSDIEQPFSVSYTKYNSSWKYKLRISIPNVGVLETIDYNTSGTSFTLTQATIESLYQRYTNTNTFNLGFAVETWNSAGTSKLSSGNEKIISCKITGATPIFTDFDFEDINTTVTALTGNNKINVNGYSNIKVTISTTNKAVAQKGATMSKYRFVNGSQSIDITYSDDNDVYGIIPNCEGGTYQVFAIDSRNNSTLVTKLATQVINYTPISINTSSKVERNNGGVGGAANLSYSGTIWNNSFGSVSNSVVSSKYEFKKTDSSQWIDLTTLGITPTDITPTITNNTFSYNGLVRSDNNDTTFDLQSSYDFRITITDKLSTAIVQLTPMASAIPNLSFADEGVGIMCDYDESLGGYLQVGGERIDLTDIYSESEVKTNKVWINNKPIYRKVVAVGFPTTSSASVSTNHNISNIEMITEYYLMWYDTSDKRWFNFYKDTSGSYYVQIDGISSTQVKIKANNTSVNWNSRTSNKYAVIEYTKTTN